MHFPMQHLQPLSGTCLPQKKPTCFGISLASLPGDVLQSSHITEFCFWLASFCKHATSMLMRQLKMQQPGVPLQPARVA